MNMLRFTPYAWAKLIYMRDAGPTEVAGYGVSSLEDPLLVEDFQLVKQEATSVTFEFDNDGLSDYMEDMSEEGFQPSQFLRILIHTHPCNSAAPSRTDEENFRKKFSDCNWAIMFILAQGGQTTCAIKYKNPEMRIQLETTIDYSVEFDGSEHEEWQEEYESCIKEKKYIAKQYRRDAINKYHHNNDAHNYIYDGHNYIYDSYDDEDFKDYKFSCKNDEDEPKQITLQELAALEMEEELADLEEIARENGHTAKEVIEIFGGDNIQELKKMLKGST